MPARKLTYTTAIVLHAVAAGHRYGFDIMDATGLPSGTVYPLLRRLEREGLLASRWEDAEVAGEAQRPARRYYQISSAGTKVLVEARARFHGLERVLPPAEAR